MSGQTEADVFARLYAKYATNGDAVCPHLAIGHSTFQRSTDDALPGFVPKDSDRSIRRIDAFIMRRSGIRWAVEIKVTAADLRQELKRPEKTALWRAHTHSFYYAVPPELEQIALTEVPPEFGVLVAGSWLRNARRGPKNPTPLPIPDDTWRRLAARHGEIKFRAWRDGASGVHAS